MTVAVPEVVFRLTKRTVNDRLNKSPQDKEDAYD